MEVILLEEIENLGTGGDKVSVKAGFARNFLVPHGKAKMATAENLAEFEAQRAELERAAAAAKAEAEQRKAAIESLGVIEIRANVGAEGKLFGSVGVGEICEAIEAMGGDVQKSELRMPEGALRMTGEHVIDVHLYTDIDTEITVNIIGVE